MALSASFSLAGCAAIDELKEAFLRWVESEKLPSGPGYTGGGVWEVVGKQIPPKKPPKASKPSRQVKSARKLRRPQTDFIDAVLAELKAKGVQFAREPTTVRHPKKPPIPDSTEAARSEGTEEQSAPSQPTPRWLPSRWPEAPPPGRFSRDSP
jgi:hypothetical protein